MPECIKASEVAKSFSESSSGRMYFVVGEHSMSNTHFLDDVCNTLNTSPEWLIAWISHDVYQSACSQLFEFLGHPADKKFFESCSDVASEIILEELLEEAKEKHKKALFVINDLVNTESIRAFFHTFQTMIGKGYQMHMLVSGKSNVIGELEKYKTLGFLVRTEKVILEKEPDASGSSQVLSEDVHRDSNDIIPNQGGGLL